MSKFHAYNLFSDLATYDTAKHLILKHTALQDNYVTHALSRFVFYIKVFLHLEGIFVMVITE